jgi:hypothetical protein
MIAEFIPGLYRQGMAIKVMTVAKLNFRHS